MNLSLQYLQRKYAANYCSRVTGSPLTHGGYYIANGGLLADIGIRRGSTRRILAQQYLLSGPLNQNSGRGC